MGLEATVSLPEGEVRAMIRAELGRLASEELHWRSLEKAAARIEVDPSTFKKLAREFGVPFSKTGHRTVRYYDADVDAMMRAHARFPKQPGEKLIEFPSQFLPSKAVPLGQPNESAKRGAA